MTLAAERYALLVKQLGEEMGHRRGWQGKVARFLGVHRSYVSRFMSGTLSSVGPEVIRRAVERLSLSPDFFYADEVGHYTSLAAATPSAGEPGEFGQRLAALMEAAGIPTKRALMEQVGISAMSLHRYETGEREPGASTIVAMAQALGCSADALLGIDTPDAPGVVAIRAAVRAEVRAALADLLIGAAREVRS